MPCSALGQSLSYRSRWSPLRSAAMLHIPPKRASDWSRRSSSGRPMCWRFLSTRWWRRLSSRSAGGRASNLLQTSIRQAMCFERLNGRMRHPGRESS